MRMSNDTALVAGGAGFIGSHLCEALLDEGYEVICVDNVGSGQLANIEPFRSTSHFRFIRADIREIQHLPPADEVYHLASRASPKDFTEHPVKIALTNTEGTRNLLDYAVKYDAKMLFASTSEVYGDPEVHPQPETYTGNVNIRGKRGCYDESKRFGETLTVAYNNQYNLDVRTVRIFNTYGERMRIDDGRVVPNFLSQALQNEDLTIYGEGTQTRSFCYVDDLISGLRATMNTDEIKGDVVNLGNTNEMKICELAEIILEVCDTESGLTYEELPDDDPKQRKPDISKAKQKLDWEPEIPLREGIKYTAEYFAEQI